MTTDEQIEALERKTEQLQSQLVQVSDTLIGALGHIAALSQVGREEEVFMLTVQFCQQLQASGMPPQIVQQLLSR